MFRIEDDIAGPDYNILRLRGEFDTPYVPEFEQRIQVMAQKGRTRIILNLRFLRLINSTALGVLVRAQKKLRQRGGDLVISHPSAFCTDVFAKVGLDKLFDVYEDDAEAVDAVSVKTPSPEAVQEKGDVLFSYLDEHKAQFAPRPTEIGRIRQWEEDAILFDWDAKKTNLTKDDLRKLLEPGTELRLKFKLPMAKKNEFIEVVARVETAQLPVRGIGIRVRARVTNFTNPDDRQSLSQFVQDMRFLKNELHKATGG